MNKTLAFMEQISDVPTWCFTCRQMIPAWRRYLRFVVNLDSPDATGKDFCRRCAVNVNLEKMEK